MSENLQSSLGKLAWNNPLLWKWLIYSYHFFSMLLIYDGVNYTKLNYTAIWLKSVALFDTNSNFSINKLTINVMWKL